MKKFLLILQMVPAIIQTVIAVEHAVTTPHAGAQKLDIVLNTTSKAAEAVPEILNEFKTGELQQVTTSIVNAAVASLNTAGALRPKTTQP